MKKEEDIQKEVEESGKKIDFATSREKSNKKKRIEMIRMKVDDINTRFENPRKIKRAKRKELKSSLEKYGDFGVLVIDENNSVISGNQRLNQLKELGVKEVDCKRLIGYTEIEKKAINIKANTHSGEWDLSVLAQWTADIGLDVKPDSTEMEQRTINEMELVRFERYDYVIIACRTEMDFNMLADKLGIQGKFMRINNNRKLKARAIWYDEVEDKFK